MSAFLRRCLPQARCSFPPEGAAVGVLRRRERVLFERVGIYGELVARGFAVGDAPLCPNQIIEEFTLPVGRPVAGLSYAQLAEIERANRCLPLEN